MTSTCPAMEVNYQVSWLNITRLFSCYPDQIENKWYFDGRWHSIRGNREGKLVLPLLFTIGGLIAYNFVWNDQIVDGKTSPRSILNNSWSFFLCEPCAPHCTSKHILIHVKDCAKHLRFIVSHCEFSVTQFGRSRLEQLPIDRSSLPHSLLLPPLMGKSNSKRATMHVECIVCRDHWFPM